MKATGSISRGRPAERHNTRECYRSGRVPPNIDLERSERNAVLVDRTLEEVYSERFGDALGEYNARQVEKGHPERQIADYLAHVEGDKKLNSMYEFVVQVGNKDDHPGEETARAVYEDWLAAFRERFGGQFAVKQAVVHVDEAVPHMHVEVVPCARSGRGLPVQNSMNKAVEQAGFEDYKAMLLGWDELLTAAMERHGIERVAGDREKQMGGVDIETYRRSMAVRAETRQAEERLERLRRSAEEEERRIGELDRRIEGIGERIERARAAMASAPRKSLRESVREALRGLGLGRRVKALRGRVEGLRGRISGLGGRIGDAKAEKRRLEEEARGLRGLLRGRGAEPSPERDAERARAAARSYAPPARSRGRARR